MKAEEIGRMMSASVRSIEESGIEPEEASEAFLSIQAALTQGRDPEEAISELSPKLQGFIVRVACRYGLSLSASFLRKHNLESIAEDTPSDEDPLFPSNPFRSGEEINAVRNSLWSMFQNDTLPMWKRTMAVEAMNVLNWVMLDPIKAEAPRSPSQDLDWRNVSPCIGSTDFCAAACDHDWKKVTQHGESCGKCGQFRTQSLSDKPGMWMACNRCMKPVPGIEPLSTPRTSTEILAHAQDEGWKGNLQSGDMICPTCQTEDPLDLLERQIGFGLKIYRDGSDDPYFRRILKMLRERKDADYTDEDVAEDARLVWIGYRSASVKLQRPM